MSPIYLYAQFEAIHRRFDLVGVQQLITRADAGRLRPHVSIVPAWSSTSERRTRARHEWFAEEPYTFVKKSLDQTWKHHAETRGATDSSGVYYIHEIARSDFRAPAQATAWPVIQTSTFNGQNMRDDPRLRYNTDFTALFHHAITVTLHHIP